MFRAEKHGCENEFIVTKEKIPAQNRRGWDKSIFIKEKSELKLVPMSRSGNILGARRVA